MDTRFAAEKRIYKNPQNLAHKVTIEVKVENGETPDSVLMDEMRLIFQCIASSVGAIFVIENGGE